MDKLSFRVSLGGILSALSVVLMFMTSLLPPLVYVLPAVCGALLLVIAVEVNHKWSYLTYGAVSILSLLLVPDKEAALLYVMLMGFYPTLKLTLDKLKPAVLTWAVKLIMYNLLIVLYYNLVINIVSSSTLQDDMSDFGKYGVYIFWGLTNVVFVIYDIAVGRLMYMYVEFLRGKILKKSSPKNKKEKE